MPINKKWICTSCEWTVYQYGDPILCPKCHRATMHEMEPNLMIKKYYVGAKHIGAAIAQNRNAECTRATFDEAIEDAKKMIRAEGGYDCVVVVEIVAIVRRDFPPITVEKV